LITNVYGLGPFETYLAKRDNVFPLVSGSSFYRQILPSASLNLGFSATAMHWLSNKICNISNYVQTVGAEGPELQAFRKQAHSDWRQILIHRAHELKPGGKLVLIDFGTDEQGRYLGNTDGINMFDTFNQIWCSFLEQKRIDRQEYENMTLPQYYNSVEEFSAPPVGADKPVFQAGLRLDHIDTRIVKCPFAEDFKKTWRCGTICRRIYSVNSQLEREYLFQCLIQRPSHRGTPRNYRRLLRYLQNHGSGKS